VHARQRERVRRIGVIMALAADDPASQLGIAGFLQGLQELGWVVGPNIRIDYRWGAAESSDVRQKYAREIVSLAPDVILASGSGVGELQRESRTVPIVFAGAIDPVGSGIVASLARPGGNATGFLSIEYGLGAKLLESLKEMAPRVERVAVTRDPTAPGGIGVYAAIQTSSSSLRMQVIPIDDRDQDDLERAITSFAREPNGGLIVPASARAALRRKVLISLAARHKLPAVYSSRVFVEDGGLISYSPSVMGNYRLVAGYIDRILKGEKPADLPVQAPTKYETEINMKTARTLRLDVPTTMLVRATEVIE
jgi:putative ABC transport system substrate-binding protein